MSEAHVGPTDLTQAVAKVRRFGPPGLTAVLAGVAAALVLPVVGGDGGVATEPRIPLLALVGLWGAFELVGLYLRFGKDVENADEIILTEIPLALGLLFATPTDVLIAGVGVPVLLELLRRQRGALKQAFNAVNRAVEVGVALTVYRALDPSDPLSVQGWAELCTAVLASALVSALTVAVVISLAIARLPARDFLTHVSSAVPVAVTAASVAFVAGSALRSGSAVVPALLVALAGLLALMRFTGVLAERHLDVVSLHRLGGRLATTPEVDSIVLAGLETATEMLAAPQAAAYLPVDDGPTVLEVRRSADGTALRTRVGRESLPGARGLEADRRGVVASAPLTPGQELVVRVDRVGSSRAFRAQDVRALDMVARQLGTEVRTAQLIERLRHDALHDSLTDLPNRRLLLESLQEALEARRPVELAYVGLHGLQAVDAALGYDQGDDLLTQIGTRLQGAVGSGGLVARVGDDEFALLLPDRGADAAADAVPALLETLRRPFVLSGGVDVVVRASAGVAAAGPGSDLTGQDLLRRADVAMRFARRTGRPLERYSQELDTATPERLSLAADLQAGIRRGELVLYVQPQMQLSNGEVAGVEALVRWNHPRLGLLPPAEFVPLAEQTGLDGAMTAWVLNAALKALARWRAAGLALKVSVNVPPSALADDHLRDLVEELLALRGVPGEGLVLEITESGLLTGTAAASRVLHELSCLGVRVSIDDFGTGYSSLSRLRRLPVDEIKIDRSFVRGMLDDDDDAAIVRSVVDLARALGLSCVAEGVEDAVTYAELQRLGCEAVQGYLVARPMPLDELVGWVARRGAAGRSPGDGLPAG